MNEKENCERGCTYPTRFVNAKSCSGQNEKQYYRRQELNKAVGFSCFQLFIQADNYQKK